jgi:hypothetical protein
MVIVCDPSSSRSTAMTKRLSFLLLDANVIIELFKTGLWDRLVESTGAGRPSKMARLDV